MADKTSMMDELKTKVASLKESSTILKVGDLAGFGLLIDVTSQGNVEGKYGEQTLIRGKWVEGDLTHLESGELVSLYLNGKRAEVFQNAYDGEGQYAFIFGESTTLKSGHSYIPLDLVSKIE